MFYPCSFLAQIRCRRGLAAAALAVALVSPSLVYAADAVSGGYSPDVDYCHSARQNRPLIGAQNRPPCGWYSVEESSYSVLLARGVIRS